MLASAVLQIFCSQLYKRISTYTKLKMLYKPDLLLLRQDEKYTLKFLILLSEWDEKNMYTIS